MRKRVILPAAMALGLLIAGCAKHDVAANASADNSLPADETITDNYGAADSLAGNDAAFDNALTDDAASNDASGPDDAAAGGNSF